MEISQDAEEVTACRIGVEVMITAFSAKIKKLLKYWFKK